MQTSALIFGNLDKVSQLVTVRTDNWFVSFFNVVPDFQC